MEQTDLEIRNVDCLVIGEGILGSSIANFLTQMSRNVTILTKARQGQSPFATLKNQGWMQSGACLCHDPIKDTPYLARYAFGNWLGIRHHSDGSYSAAEVTCAVGQEVRKGRTSTQEWGMRHLNEAESDYWLGEKLVQEGHHYYACRDQRFRSWFLLASIQAQTLSATNGGSKLCKRIEVERIELLEHPEEKGRMMVKADGKIYLPKKLFVCAGVGTLKLLQPFGITSDSIFSETILPNFKTLFSPDSTGLPRQDILFKLMISRSPLIKVVDSGKLCMETDHFVNLTEDYAIVRHQAEEETLLIFSEYGTPTIIQDMANMPLEDLDEGGNLLGKVRKLLGRNVPVEIGFCYKIERFVLKNSKSTEGKFSVYPFVNKLDGYDNVYWGFPGKSTFGIETARMLLSLAGISSKKKLKIQLDAAAAVSKPYAVSWVCQPINPNTKT